MDWKNIPSLASLRAFEAAARLKNLSQAAAELNVTHAAISQHLRSLEREFEIELFQREWRGIRLTNEGKLLADGLKEGFSQISRSISDLHALNQKRPIRISITPSLYERWLLNCLGDFWQKYPDIELSFQASPRLIDLEKDGYELALRYGRGDWPPYQSQFLMGGEYGVYGTRQYVQSFKKKGLEIEKADWLRAEDSPEFFELYEILGIDFSNTQNRSFKSNGEARAAMIAGHGIIAQDRRFLKHELDFGLVEEVKTICLDERLGYYIVSRKNAISASARLFVDWLKNCAER